MIAILFWPFMIASVLTSLCGVVTQRSSLLFVSAFLIAPLLLYLAATPRFLIWGIIFPLFYIGSAISIKKGAKLISVTMLIPIYLLMGWLGYIVINQ